MSMPKVTRDSNTREADGLLVECVSWSCYQAVLKRRYTSEVLCTSRVAHVPSCAHVFRVKHLQIHWAKLHFTIRLTKSIPSRLVTKPLARTPTSPLQATCGFVSVYGAILPLGLNPNADILSSRQKRLSSCCFFPRSVSGREQPCCMSKPSRFSERVDALYRYYAFKYVSFCAKRGMGRSQSSARSISHVWNLIQGEMKLTVDDEVLRCS